MFYKKFTIKDYKSFQGEQSLLFAIPKADTIGSGITYIVGGNNSGKTTMIEGLAIKEGRNIKTSERVPGASPEFSLVAESDEIVRKCNLIREESSTIKENPRLPQDEIFEIISSRRHWASSAGNIFGKVGDSFSSTLELKNRQNNLEVASELRTIEANNEKYQAFIGLVQRVIPEFTKFAVAYEDNHFIEYISNSGVRHKTELLGDGVITVIRILLQLYVAKPNPLVIDEPELSLHPSAQRKLLKILAEYSETRQIIISTHSPYMIDWEYLKTGAAINRITKDEDKYSKVYSINNFTKYTALINAGNWQMPFAMDDVAKEIFFMEDRILFVEGQEDVGLLKRENSMSNVNIFGYGVRGKDNFIFAFSLANELGYKKVSCILDGGESENKIKVELSAAFPTYKIIQWNRNDIRDKAVFTSTTKSGYFTQNGEKKDPQDLDDFDEKIAELKAYLIP